jgi:hypothetical protein
MEDTNYTEIQSLEEFIIDKLKFWRGNESRRDYIGESICGAFASRDEDGLIDEREHLIDDVDFLGYTNHEIKNTWHLFDYLFNLIDRIAELIKTSDFTGISDYLQLIDQNIGHLMGKNTSFFNINMQQDELFAWLITEIEDFKHLVEERGIWKILNDKDESVSQEIFRTALTGICKKYGVQMICESDVGSGKPDFIFSQGEHSKVCVELKLAKSDKLIDGHEKQLVQYNKSEKRVRGIYVVFDNGGENNTLSRFKTYLREAKTKGPLDNEVIIIDATEKKSASKQ